MHKRFFLLTRFSGPAQSLSLLSGSLVFSMCTLLLLDHFGFDMVAAVRDRSLSPVPEAGLISDIGILLMAIAGIASFTCGTVCHSLALAAFGVFCTVFALDDALLIHEGLGWYEKLVFLTYGLAFLSIFYLFVAQTGQWVIWPLLVGFFAFAFSVVVDVAWNRLVNFLNPSEQIAAHLQSAGYILEDVPKFAGIVVLAAFAIGETALCASSAERVPPRFDAK